MIGGTVRFRSIGTTRSPDIAKLLEDPDGAAHRRLRAIAGEATKEAKRLMRAELRYPVRPSDSPPGGKERRRRPEHLIDTIRSTVVVNTPTGPRIQIQAHRDFIFLEKNTKAHHIPSPGHPQSSYTRRQWSVTWAPPVWHTPGGEHRGWVGDVPHPGTTGHHFLRRAVRHAVNAS